MVSEGDLRDDNAEALDVAITEGLADASDDEEAWRHLTVATGTPSLGFSDYQNTPLGQLSPGSALRAYLAIALSRRSVDLFLLDEPLIIWIYRVSYGSSELYCKRENNNYGFAR